MGLSFYIRPLPRLRVVFQQSDIRSRISLEKKKRVAKKYNTCQRRRKGENEKANNHKTTVSGN